MYGIGLCKSGEAATLAAIIHVKLTGEGDFGPVDLECAIPPARLPVVMAALFGQPVQAPVAQVTPSGLTGNTARSTILNAAQAGDSAIARPHTPNRQQSIDRHTDDIPGGVPVHADEGVYGAELAGTSPQTDYPQAAFSAIEPGAFITSFMGSLGDLVARIQPRGFAETILIAAIWLHYRDGRGFVTRDDVRRVLRRQEHLRMPRNFSRDFHVAVSRGYLDAVENEDGYAVSQLGYQWFQSECRN